MFIIFIPIRFGWVKTSKRVRWRLGEILARFGFDFLVGYLGCRWKKTHKQNPMVRFEVFHYEMVSNDSNLATLEEVISFSAFTYILFIVKLTFQHFDADVGCSIWSWAYLTEFPYLVTFTVSQFLSKSLAKLEYVKYFCGICGCYVPGLTEPKLYSLASIEVKPAPP